MTRTLAPTQAPAQASAHADPAQALSRREFVGLGSGVLACLALAGCASLAAHPVTLVGGRAAIDTSRHPELATAGGSIRIQPTGFTEPVYVLALGGGEYRVLSPICTHRGCTVDVAGSRLVCPCHGSTYDQEGRVLKGPAERPLTRFPARLAANGVLEIDFGSAP